MNRTKALEELSQNFHALSRRTLLAHKLKNVNGESPLYPPQFLVIQIIRETENCSIKTIAEKMHITSSAATQLVEKMVQVGFVERRPSDEDRRAVVLTISGKTAEKMAILRRAALENIQEVFDVLDDDELAQFTALHKKVVTSMNSKYPIQKGK